MHLLYYKLVYFVLYAVRLLLEIVTVFYSRVSCRLFCDELSNIVRKKEILDEMRTS